MKSTNIAFNQVDRITNTINDKFTNTIKNTLQKGKINYLLKQ